jgi:hypothetical protein
MKPSLGIGLMSRGSFRRFRSGWMASLALLVGLVAYADVNVTYGTNNGIFVAVAQDNPFGLPDESNPNVPYTMRFTFLQPTNAEDLQPGDPTVGQWNVPATAYVLANGVSVYFSGMAAVTLYANAPDGGGPVANFHLGNFHLSFQNYLNALSFPDDDASHLQELGYNTSGGGASYVTVNSPQGATFNDLDPVNLISAKTVPESGGLAMSLAAALVAFAAMARRLRTA